MALTERMVPQTWCTRSISTVRSAAWNAERFFSRPRSTSAAICGRLNGEPTSIGPVDPESQVHDLLRPPPHPAADRRHPAGRAHVPQRQPQRTGRHTCEHLRWQTASGRDRIQLAMRLLEALERLSILTLPPKQGPGRARQEPLVPGSRSAPQPAIEWPLAGLPAVRLRGGPPRLPRPLDRLAGVGLPQALGAGGAECTVRVVPIGARGALGSRARPSRSGHATGQTNLSGPLHSARSVGVISPHEPIRNIW